MKRLFSSHLVGDVISTVAPDAKAARAVTTNKKRSIVVVCVGRVLELINPHTKNAKNK